MTLESDISPKPDGALRIVAWNCNRGFPVKVRRLLQLDPDIAIVPQGCDPCRLDEQDRARFTFYDAIGDSETNRLVTATTGQVNVRLATCGQSSCRAFDCDVEAPLEWVSSVEVENSFGRLHLFGMWNSNNRCTAERRWASSEWPHIQGGQLLEAYSHVFSSGGEVVVAGDFNNSACWDDWQFREMADAYFERGLVSAVHKFHGIDFGDAEEPATLWWSGGGRFHIDYVFVPDTWTILNAQVGSESNWHGGLATNEGSDHAPIVVDVRP